MSQLPGHGEQLVDRLAVRVARRGAVGGRQRAHHGRQRARTGAPPPADHRASRRRAQVGHRRQQGLRHHAATTELRHAQELPRLHRHLPSTIRYDTRCCFNVRSKADMRTHLNLLHGTDN